MTKQAHIKALTGPIAAVVKTAGVLVSACVLTIILSLLSTPYVSALTPAAFARLFPADKSNRYVKRKSGTKFKYSGLPADRRLSLAYPQFKYSGMPIDPRIMRNGKLIELTKIEKLKYAIDLVKNKRFSLARRSVSKGDPVAKKLIEWLILQHPKTNASINSINKFVINNPEWPRQRRFQASAEASLFAHLSKLKSKPEKAKTFKKRNPRTGPGKIALARALFKAKKEKPATKWLKSAWRDHALDKKLEQRILGKIAKLLTAEDHLARAAMLTYGRKRHSRKNRQAILRLAKRVRGSKGKALKAIAALLNRKKRRSAFRLYKKVPKDMKAFRPLRYALGYYLRRRDKYNKLNKLIEGLPDKGRHGLESAAWWDQRRILVRHLLGNIRYKQAYKIIAPHGLTKGVPYIEAEFLAGWIALVYLDQPKIALKHFSAMRSFVKAPRSIARSEYWVARCHDKLKGPIKAKLHFKAATKYPKTYYGQLARDRLGYKQSAPADVLAKRPAARNRFTFDSNELVRAIRLMAKAKRPKLVPAFVYRLAKTTQTHDQFANLAALAWELNMPHLGIRISKLAAMRGHDMGLWGYPSDVLPKYAQLTKPVDQALIHGLIRQESEFNAGSKSHAGAHGLMQLMPGTAKIVARQYKQRYRRAKLTKDPAYNLKLGSALMHDLIKAFNGSYIMALVAYNAGPGRAIQWRDRYGDPRDAFIDPINWVENIPFEETRNYVQKVMENLQIYRSSFTPGHKMTLTQDLNRGEAPDVYTSKTSLKSPHFP